MIPNILWQTWKTKTLPNLLKKQSESWNYSNPQLKKEFMDDQQCSGFILKHFGFCLTSVHPTCEDSPIQISIKN